MLNQFVIVGRVKDKKLVSDNELILTLNVQRNYKNPDTGVYDADVLDISVGGLLVNNTKDYIEKDSIVGVKGHLEEPQRIVADKVTFLPFNLDTQF